MHVIAARQLEWLAPDWAVTHLATPSVWKEDEHDPAGSSECRDEVETRPPPKGLDSQYSISIVVCLPSVTHITEGTTNERSKSRAEERHTVE